MSIQHEHMTDTTITSPAEQSASAEISKPVHHGPPSLLSQIGHFLLHWVEMGLSMCIGGGLLNLLFFWAAGQVGYPDLRQQLPELSLLVIAFNVTLPMVAWMRFRGMAWRPIWEMAGETIALAILLLGLAWVGIIPRSGLREWQINFCGVACALMFIPMLFRLDHYTGRMGHHAHHG
jgi:hypothetical protein